MTKQIQLLVLLVTFSTTTIYSQITQGNWLVGGSGSFSSSKNTITATGVNGSDNTSNLSISPNIGYFFLDKFVAGLKPGFTWYKSETNAGAYSNIKRFFVGPFARYYLLETDKRTNILVDASYQYGSYYFKPNKGNINVFSLSAGPVIYFNNSVGIEFLVGYFSKTEDVDASYKTTQSAFQVNIGLQIHLEKL